MFSADCPPPEHEQCAIAGTLFVFGTFQLFPPLSTRHRHDDTTPGRNDMKGRLGGDEDATTTRVGMGRRAHPHKNGSFFFVNTFIYLLTPTLSSPAVPPPPHPQHSN